MTRTPLTLAISHYDHVVDLVSGRAPVEGVELNALDLPIIDIFYRFLTFREFDVAEISMAKYVSMRSQGDESLIAIPVFPSRVHRHSCVYIRADGPVRQPSDLNGRRVGIPEWAETALVYARGMLASEYGVDLHSIDWVQAGVDQAGRMEKVRLALPDGLRVTPAPTQTLNDMLLRGEIDAIMAAWPPNAFTSGDSRVKRLFPDFVSVERRYFEKTKIFPIMHTVAFRRDVLDRNPWIAANLYAAFVEAKRRSVQRALSVVASVFPIPWWYDHAREAKEMFDGDLWPYGVAGNRHTLDTFLHWSFEQGVCHTRLTPEEIFLKSVQSSSKQ